MIDKQIKIELSESGNITHSLVLPYEDACSIFNLVCSLTPAQLKPLEAFLLPAEVI